MNPSSICEPRFQGIKGKLSVFLAAVWFLFVLICYFDRPFDFRSIIESFRGPGGVTSQPGLPLMIWGESILTWLLAALIVILLAGIGSQIARFIGFHPQGDIGRLTFHLGLGIAGVNAFWIGLGFNGLWQKPLLIIAFAVLLVLAIKTHLEDEWDIFRFFNRSSWSRSIGDFSWPAKLIFAVTAAYFLFSMGHGLVPETFYDSMVYHLAVPAYWLQHHGIQDFPTNFFSNYPYGGETFFFNGFLWGPLFGSQVAKTLNILILSAAALSAYDWVTEITSGPRARETGLLAGALILTTPLLTMNVWSTQLEGILSFFMILFFRSIVGSFVHDRPSYVITAGILGGTVLSVKYTALLAIVAGCLSLVFSTIRKRASWSRYVVGFGLAAIPGILPWIIKNHIYTGNPFYPYLMDWFKGRRLPVEGYARLLAEQREIHMDQWSSWLLLPWKLTMNEPVGPLLLASIPMVALFKLKNPTVRFLLLSVFLFFAVSLPVTHHMRFLLVGFSLFYIVAATTLTHTDRWVWKGILLASAFSAFLGLFTLGNVSRHYYSCGGIWRGNETRESYLQRVGVTPYYEAPAWVGQHLPPDTCLLIVGDARGLYYPRPFYTNSVFDEPFLAKAVRDGLDANGIRTRLDRMGVTHLVINEEEGLRSAADYRHYELNADEWGRLDAFMRRGVEPVVYLRHQQVYRLLERLKDEMTTSYPHSLFLFSSNGTRFVKAVLKRDWAAASDLADRALSTCPSAPFWWEQKAQVAGSIGNKERALRLFRKAARLGVLQMDGYRQWIRLLNETGKPREAVDVRKTALRWYPDLF